MVKKIYDKFSLPYLITKSARAVVKDYERAMSDMEISPLQGGILFVIAELSPINQTDIANILFIDKVTLSKMIFKIEEKRLIQTVKNSDRRSKYWGITDKGLSLLEKVKEVDSVIETNLKKILRKSGHNSKDLTDALRFLLAN